MKQLYKRMPVFYGIVTGVGVSVFFILFEYFLVATGISECGLLVDSCLRVIIGVIALLLMKQIYREQFTKLFIAKIPKSTWVYCIPLFLYLAIEFLHLPISERLTTAYISGFLLSCVQQLATGFWEEAASKGLVMSGMLLKWNNSTKGRIGMVSVTGLLFGAAHILNVVFGNDIISCLWNALFSAAFGMFLASIYLHSGNITLCMVIHAVWDIIIRVDRYFCVDIQEGVILEFINISHWILELVIFPVVAIKICMSKDKEIQKGTHTL